MGEIGWHTTPPLKHLSTTLKSNFTESSPNADSSPIVVKRIKVHQSTTRSEKNVGKPSEFEDFMQAESKRENDCLRLLVTDVISQEVIKVLDPLNFKLFQLIITGVWLECCFKPGKFIHVVNPRENLLEDCMLGNDDLVVIDPDELIAALTVADSFQCIRRSVLKLKMKSLFQSTIPMVYGNIMHDLFQVSRWFNDRY